MQRLDLKWPIVGRLSRFQPSLYHEDHSEVPRSRDYASARAGFLVSQTVVCATEPNGPQLDTMPAATV
jgi:hypothetical protein